MTLNKVINVRGSMALIWVKCYTVVSLTYDSMNCLMALRISGFGCAQKGTLHREWLYQWPSGGGGHITAPLGMCLCGSACLLSTCLLVVCCLQALRTSSASRYLQEYSHNLQGEDGEGENGYCYVIFHTSSMANLISL